ncbi:MAG TPA: glycosyltransferase family 39 protein [Nitrospinaceae bacterium]|nr:glycosyltransferase family 39 protein [Nitrospinaceae bacterium]
MQARLLLNNYNGKGYLQLGAFSLFCFLAFTYNLSEVPPYHADENFYVTSTRNMIDSGDYITPVYNDKKRFAKPIIFYWMVAASYKIFGVNVVSARLVSSFFASLCIPIVYMIARRLFDPKIAVISALLLPGCYLHFQIARWAITDMALNFFILLAFYFFIRGFQDQSNKNISYYFAYICMGIGFMIKGPIAIIIPGLVIFGFLITLRNWEELSRLRLGYGIIILAAIILPWFVAMLVIHGDEFKNHILGAELHDRMIHDTPFSLYYFGVIIRYYLPWSFFFVAALIVRFLPALNQTISSPSIKSYFSFLPEKLKVWYGDITHKDNQAFLFSIIWLLFPLILFTLFRIEHSRYMLPVSAPIVMITAQFFSQLMDSPNGFQGRTFIVSFYLTLIFYLLIFTLTAVGIFFLFPHFSAPTGLMALSVLSFFGAVLLFILHKSKKYSTLIIALSITQIITLTSLSGESLSYFNRYPMKKFANHILTDPQLEKRIGLYRLGNHRARMGVMTGLPSIYLKSPEELELFIKSGNNVYIVMRQSDLKRGFNNLPMTITAIDTAWKKIRLNRDKIALLLKNGLTPYLQEYSERYILLKT